MITLTRLSGEAFMLNVTHIETIEANPDTRITLGNGKQLYVKERPDEVRSAILTWLHTIRPAGGG